MNKTLIRSYAVGSEGDLNVVGYGPDGKRNDLSKLYEDIPRNRHMMRPDAYLDVFRYEDGDLTWSGTPNGHEAANAVTWKVLLDAFVQDLTAAEGSPRAF